MKHWLMKAEPESRLVKGKDVKFSVDDFENVKTTPWEGVRNAEARNIMQKMEVGDQVLFYHSSCKVPGVAAFAEISKEAYPDYTAWDVSHPYYDEKTNQEKPKWYMVDVTFKSRAMYYVPLALMRRIAAESEPPADVAYIGTDGVKAIKEMALINRGRLSVQPVEEAVFKVIQMLAERGGWEERAEKKGTRGKGKQAKANSEAEKEKVNAIVEDGSMADKGDGEPSKPALNKRKREDNMVIVEDGVPLRRSTRTRK